MGIEQNKELVRKYFSALGSGDVAGAMSMMTDDGTFWVAGKPELLPIAGLKSKQEIVQVFAGLGVMLKEGLEMKITGMVAEGDKVALESESYGKASNGRIYNNLYHYLLEIRGGKIASVKEYMDTLHVKAVFIDP